MEWNAATFAAIGQIIWIDLLLSGDNAVVIALACRSLPDNQRRLGILLGAGAAVGLRILFALVITQILAIPFLQALGGVLLFWIAIKLVRGEEEEERKIKASDQLWGAVRTIAMADAVMSLDNVVAISAAAQGNVMLFIFGLLLSVPLIVFGSTLLMGLLSKFPIFVWAGAALLGWIAGEMLARDTALLDLFGYHPTDAAEYAFAAVGALFVLVTGYFLKTRADGEAKAG
jgi:YjbE family integral membrane protein